MKSQPPLDFGKSWTVKALVPIGGAEKDKILEQMLIKLNRQDSKISLGEKSLDCLKLVSFELSNRVVNVAIVTPLSLGFSLGSTPQKDVFKKAEELGLSKCPPEVALSLFLNVPSLFQDGTSTVVAMEPIYLTDNDPRIFWIKVSKSSDNYKRMLLAENGSDYYGLPVYAPIVFVIEDS